MNNPHCIGRRPIPAFTLVELLTVIGIIGILAALLMTVLVHMKIEGQKTQAKTEIAEIVAAINGYETDYGRFPISAAEQTAAGTNDITIGLVSGFGPGAGAHGWSFDNNSNMVAILADLTTFPNGVTTVNAGHVKNTKQTKYLTPKFSGYDPATADPNPPPGVDNTGVYRDPWGKPYVITVDLSGDDECSDLLYSLASVSQPSSGGSAGINGLANPNLSTNPDNFLFHGRVMVWSAGPDRQYSPTDKANAGVNKDNLVSW